jgi:hypothetical protein
MNTQRIFEAMALKESLDQKRLDDELERVVNTDTPLDIKLFNIESVLQKMVNLDGIVKKLNEVIQVNNNNNKDDVKHQD